MTLTEARKTLESFQAWRRYDGPIGEGPKQPDPKTIGEALDIAIRLLPIESPRPSASKRLDYILERIGFNPFNKKKDSVEVTWRQCIIFKLNLESFTNAEITKATGMSHSAVTVAIHVAEDRLKYRDELFRAVWSQFLEIIQGSYYD